MFRCLLPVFLSALVSAARAADPVLPTVNQHGTLPIAGTSIVPMKFAIVLLTQPARAEGLATVTNGFVTSVDVTTGGSGYLAPPLVILNGGGGTGARATPVLSAGAVTRIVVQSAGAHYTSAPTVYIAPPAARPAVTTLWSNDGTSVAGSQPQEAVALQVSGGTYSALLGYTGLPHMAALSPEILTYTQARLRVWYRYGQIFQRLPVDVPLQYVPYAEESAYAQTAGGVADGSITLAKLAPDAFSAAAGTGDGAGITALNASTAFNSGTLPDARLSLPLQNLSGNLLSSPDFSNLSPTFGRLSATTSGKEFAFVSTGIQSTLDDTNVMSIMATSQKFAAIRFLAENGTEKMAVGYAMYGLSEPFRENGYIEVSDANQTGHTPGFKIIQTTTYEGQMASGFHTRLFFDPYGTIHFFQRDGISPLLEMDDTTIRTYLPLHYTPQATPTSPREGDVYANSSDHHLYFYNGTVWKQLD